MGRMNDFRHAAPWSHHVTLRRRRGRRTAPAPSDRIVEAPRNFNVKTRAAAGPANRTCGTGTH